MHPTLHSRPRSRYVLALATLLAFSTTFVSSAHAADADNEAEAVLMKRGIESFKHEDYEAAREDFARAYELVPKASTLINLALAEIQSHRSLDGLRHLRLYLMRPDALPDKAETIRSKWLPRAEQETSRIAIDAPSGAEIAVDGVVQARAPLPEPVDVTIGEHDVVARLGTWSATTHVSLRPGEVGHVRFEQAKVALVSPAPAASPPPPSNPTTERPVVRRPSTAKIATVAALGGASLAAGGIGVVFAVDSQSKGNQYKSASCEDLPPQPAGSLCGGLGEDGRRDFHAAQAFYISGGVLAGAAILTWLLWPNAPADDGPMSWAEASAGRWTAHPVFDGRSAGAALEGSF